MKAPSIKNLKILLKAKPKTWGPKKSKTPSPDQQDIEQTNAPDAQPGILAVRYESTSTVESTSVIDPCQVHQTATRPSTARIEDGVGSVPPSLSAVALPKSPLPKPKAKTVKKVAWFLRLKKAKTSPYSPSASPTALERIEEPDEDYDSPRTTSSSLYSQQATPPTTSSSIYPPSTLQFAISSAGTSTPSPLLTPSTSTSASDNADVTTIKHTIRTLKLASLASTQNALRLALEAHATGLTTLSRLHVQASRLAHAEAHVYEAALPLRIAAERTRRLATPHNLHFSNPLFTSHSLSPSFSTRRAERTALRHRAWASSLRNKLTVVLLTQSATGETTLVERAKYQFEPDSEDEAFEEEIEGGLGRLGGVVPQLREMAVEMGRVGCEGSEGWRG
ncbi:Protein transport protein S9 plasma membrane t-SNARE [Paraconiothyrium brasiliense]|uniref:Protein transport protein S9 plasma membrane t-SNARE n=1 Tax=Paraconiothyrium brasiliense TaxID=300254 RepID=A0ABR3RPZ7_9PLEO